jgi:hypothetical protein
MIYSGSKSYVMVVCWMIYLLHARLCDFVHTFIWQHNFYTTCRLRKGLVPGPPNFVCMAIYWEPEGPQSSVSIRQRLGNFVERVQKEWTRID